MSHPRTVVLALAALVITAACAESTPGGVASTVPPGEAGSGGNGDSTAGTEGGGTFGAGGIPTSAGTGGFPASSGAGGVPASSGMGGFPGSSGAGTTSASSAAGGLPESSGAGGTPASSGAGAAGAGKPSAAGAGGDEPQPSNRDYCLHGYDPLPSDDTMKFGPHLFTPEGGGAVDTIVQPEVLQWMTDNEWPRAYLLWNVVRSCYQEQNSALLQSQGFTNVCSDYPVLVPQDQSCKTAGDGYQYLLFHRHLLQTLKQLWPQHAADFDGFPSFPTTKAELPAVWNETDPTWSSQMLAAAEIADNIEQHLDKFPSEGAVGYWLQCPLGSAAPEFAPQLPEVGLHYLLHQQWSRGSLSPHGLNNPLTAVTNYMFWKLHGWIDKVWEKYRVAKGLTVPGSPEMQKYEQDLAAQCYGLTIELVPLSSQLEMD